MLGRYGPVMKSVESVLRLVHGRESMVRRFVKEYRLRFEAGVKERVSYGW